MCTSPASSTEGAWLAPRRGSAPVTAFPDPRLRASGHARARARLRALVPRAPHRGRADLRSLLRTRSRCRPRRWRGVPVRIGSRRELNPDKIAGQIALQRARLLAARTGSWPTRARRRGSSTSKACRQRKVARDPQRHRRCRRRSHARRRGACGASSTWSRTCAREGARSAAAPRSTSLGRGTRRAVRLVGDGPRLGAPGARRRASASRHAVSFLGHREDVPALLARPTRSCCRRAPRRFRMARSKRWPPACRSSPARRRPARIDRRRPDTGCWCRPATPRRSPRALMR